MAPKGKEPKKPATAGTKAGSRPSKEDKAKGGDKASNQSKMIGFLQYHSKVKGEADATDALQIYGTMAKTEKEKFLADFEKNKKKPNGLKFAVKYRREAVKIDENESGTLENYFTRLP